MAPTIKVGVLAQNRERAQALIEELQLTEGQALGTSSYGGRGCSFSALLVDESAWPMTEDQRSSLLPALDHTNGQVYRIERVSAWPQ